MLTVPRLRGMVILHDYHTTSSDTPPPRRSCDVHIIPRAELRGVKISDDRMDLVELSYRLSDGIERKICFDYDGDNDREAYRTAHEILSIIVAVDDDETTVLQREFPSRIWVRR